MIDNPYVTETPMPWMADDAPAVPCADSTLFPDAWFPDKHTPDGGQSRAAVTACRACPLRAECLTWALDERVEFGTFGGVTAGKRRQLRRERWAA